MVFVLYQENAPLKYTETAHTRHDTRATHVHTHTRTPRVHTHT
jgi:hypothetical protein